MIPIKNYLRICKSEMYLPHAMISTVLKTVTLTQILYPNTQIVCQIIDTSTKTKYLFISLTVFASCLAPTPGPRRHRTQVEPRRIRSPTTGWHRYHQTFQFVRRSNWRTERWSVVNIIFFDIRIRQSKCMIWQSECEPIMSDSISIIPRISNRPFETSA